MKNILFFVLLALTSFRIYAQPTLTQSSNSPVAGDTIKTLYCDTAGAYHGWPGGAGHTWDLSMLSPQDSDQLTFISCVATGYCDSFPGSNLAIQYDVSSYEFFKSDATGFYFIGAKDDTIFSHEGDAKNSIIHFPMSYGTSHSDTSHSVVYTPSDTSIQWVIRKYDYDGYGTLMLPNDTLTNVLKSRVTATYIDTVFSMGMTLSFADQQTTDNWYDSGCHFPVLVISYDTFGTGTPYPSSVDYSLPKKKIIPPTYVADHNLSNSSMDIFPSPASDIVNIRFNSATGEVATIEITDVTGKSVGRAVVNPSSAGVNSIKMPVRNLPAGTYFARLQTVGNIQAQKFQVTH